MLSQTCYFVILADFENGFKEKQNMDTWPHYQLDMG
jgi:hypothetical protein